MIKAIIHDTASRRTFIPSLHFVYEGETFPFYNPNLLVVDVDNNGDVKSITPADDSTQVSYFYIQKEDDDQQPTLHIQGVFPEIALEEEHTPAQRGILQSSSDLLEEFLVRNEFIRAKIREAKEDGFFSPTNVSLNVEEGDSQKDLISLLSPPPLIHTSQPAFLQHQHPWIEEEPLKLSPISFTPSLPSPSPISFAQPTITTTTTTTTNTPQPTSTSPRRVGLSITPPTENGNAEVISSPDRRKGAAPTIISPYKGLSRHPSPTPIPAVKSNHKLHRGLFLEDPSDLLSRTPSPSNNSSTPSSVSATSPLPSPVSSPPQLELKNQVDRILHTALQLKTSLELMGANGFDPSMEELSFEPIARRPTTIRRSDGNMVMPQ